ncbi:hypothetical protein, partial [Streptococcus suis]|uniref:hypothetical protein n=1 Tax=Streptococcus suis TaxID=1307 RepID=UPI001C2EF557
QQSDNKLKFHGLLCPRKFWLSLRFQLCYSSVYSNRFAIASITLTVTELPACSMPTNTSK